MKRILEEISDAKESRDSEPALKRDNESAGNVELCKLGCGHVVAAKSVDKSDDRGDSVCCQECATTEDDNRKKGSQWVMHNGTCLTRFRGRRVH